MKPEQKNIENFGNHRVWNKVRGIIFNVMGFSSEKRMQWPGMQCENE